MSAGGLGRERLAAPAKESCKFGQNGRDVAAEQGQGGDGDHGDQRNYQAVLGQVRTASRHFYSSSWDAPYGGAAPAAPAILNLAKQ